MHPLIWIGLGKTPNLDGVDPISHGIQLNHCSHSNSAGHYCGINIVEILKSGRISSLVFPQRVARNIFFYLGLKMCDA